MYHFSQTIPHRDDLLPKPGVILPFYFFRSLESLKTSFGILGFLLLCLVMLLCLLAVFLLGGFFCFRLIHYFVMLTELFYQFYFNRFLIFARNFDINRNVCACYTKIKLIKKIYFRIIIKKVVASL